MPGAICSSPGFGNNCQNTPWFVLMLPYIEQVGHCTTRSTRRSAWRGPDRGLYRPASSSIARSSPTKIASFQCPSDNQSTILAMTGLSGFRSSRRRETTASTGETWMTARLFWVVPSRHFPNFGCSLRSASAGPATGRYNCRIASVTDGTEQHGHFVSELLQGATDDIRGTIWVLNAGAGSYNTRFTPNGYTDYVAIVPPWSTLVGVLPMNNFDNLASFGGSGPGTSPAAPGSLCDSQPGQQLGCYNQGSEGSEFAGSRSRHPGA